MDSFVFKITVFLNLCKNLLLKTPRSSSISHKASRSNLKSSLVREAYMDISLKAKKLQVEKLITNRDYGLDSNYFRLKLVLQARPSTKEKETISLNFLSLEKILYVILRKWKD